VPIERFVWTAHAKDRCARRLLHRSAVERAIGAGHADRHLNRGDADWLVHGLLADGRRVEVVYDHPLGNDHNAVLIVSVWDF
jgi:hypothetical protein